jgi:lecithin-cholesterol acyltransferase
MWEGGTGTAREGGFMATKNFSSRAVGLVVAASAALGALPSAASAAGRVPVVLFPGYGATKVAVTVHDQVALPGCPRSGTFEDWLGDDSPSTTFSQVCRDKLLTLRYDPDRRKPMARRFSFPRGVTVHLPGYGKTSSAPFYEPLYKALVAAGYVRNRSIRVAGYNPRLTPDMDGFLRRTKRLIQATYRANGRRPVHLVGHSNGPIYAQYLLTHTSRAWRHRYIHGFTPLAGNFPGQGQLYMVLFTGLNVETFSFPQTSENAASSARMWQSQPGTYLSLADPDIFGSREVVVRDTTTGRSYTPRDYRRLLTDAGLRSARAIADHYIGFVKFADRAHFPFVDVYAEKGSGIDTPVGAPLPNLSVGQVFDPTSTPLFTRPGDINQEDITNDAVRAWRKMRCFRFSLTDNPGINHLVLPADDAVIKRLLAHLRRPRSDCP